MTLVDAATGEVLHQMDAGRARALTDRIKVAVDATWELVREAYEGRAWVALGYSSWDDYCTREFGSSRLRLPREEREEVVASLRSAGLSIRAIAAATGHPYETVRRDLSGDPNGSPDPGLVDAEVLDDQRGPTITGTDGKRYPAPTPAPKPRRSPLADDARTAGWQFRKAVERIERIAADDRYPANKTQVAAQLRGHLMYAVEVCQDLLDGFDTEPEQEAP